jgi:exopolysaccharide/PEP-CTERM locus tyrosine autokinase
MSRIEKAMEKARELATQPHLPDPPRPTSTCANVAGKVDMENRRLVAANEYNLPITEEYRKLKSIIVQMTAKNPLQNLLLVSSSIGGEGKSMTALNLAISLAQEHDKKVLLIDADLRKPSIGKYLGLTPTTGLAECLKEGVALDDVLIETGLGSLTFLPAGAADNNPVELYSSQKMKDLLADIKERFSGGYVIIDSSPVLPFAEARILANLADGVVFVVKEGGTSLKNIEEGLLTLFEANVIGMVFNKATTASLAGGYHYYYYDYDYRRRGTTRPMKEPSRFGSFLQRFRKSQPDSPPGEPGHV